jgi:transcriptional regulator with XRE-family HTH domain
MPTTIPAAAGWWTTDHDVMYLDLCTMLTALKRHRERQGLSLSDVAERSGMDRTAVSRLKSGACLNPTLETLYRYAEAVRAEIGFTIRTA